MPIRHPRLAMAAIVGLGLIGGCALQPTSQEDPFADLATRSQLDTRFDTLEHALDQRCVGEEVSQEAQQRRLERLDGDVRELGSLLRGLRADVGSLERAPSPAQAECPATVEAGLLENKQVLGRSEWVGFPTIGTYLKARIDSGADTSSLSATDITRLERDGENWVRFKLALEEDDAAVAGVRDKWIEAPVERRVRVVQASGEESRPVVSLLMTLGPIRQKVEFTLNDRSHLSHPVLLGRRFMMDIAVIDVADSYRHPRPEFPGGASPEAAAADEALDEDGDGDDDDEG